MPKIKDLSNSQLSDYQDAYHSMLQTDPSSAKFKRKHKCIELALHRRDLINYDLDQPKKKPGLFKRMFSIFKKKK